MPGTPQSFLGEERGHLMRRRVSEFLYGRRFNDGVEDWEHAARLARGYSDEAIVRSVASAAAAARDSTGVVERDGHLISDEPTDWRLVASLALARSRVSGRLEICDYGGSLGSKYYQTRPWHPILEPFTWSVIEQDVIAKHGQRDHQTDNLIFHEVSSISWSSLAPDVTLFLSSLQYTMEPRTTLSQASEVTSSLVLVDNTPIIPGDRDVPTVQRVRTSRYRTSYPAWLIAEATLATPTSLGWSVQENWISQTSPERTTSGRLVRWGGVLALRGAGESD